MANELAIAEQWLYETLSGDAQLAAAAVGGVWLDTAPSDTPYPYVTFQFIPGSQDLKTANAIRIWANTLWLVKATAKVGAHGALVTIANRIDAVLHLGTGTVGTGRVYWCERESPFSQPITENGVQYRQVGGLYRIRVQDPAS